MIVAMIANVNRGPDQEAFKPWDFFPIRSLTKREKPQTPVEQLAVVEMWNAALGGIDQRRMND